MTEIRLRTPKELNRQLVELVEENRKLKERLKTLTPKAHEIAKRRDEFVKAALQGIASYNGSLPRYTAAQAIELADATIAALES